MIRVILAIRGSAEFTDTVHMLSQELNRLHECETEGKFIEFDAFLSAREAEMQAAERLLTAIDEVDSDVTFDLQAIAQGVSAKPPVVRAAERLTMAEKSVTGTLFEDQIPSLEMQVIIQEFEESFPGIVDELQSFDPPGDDADWLQYLVPEWITDRTETALPNTEAGGDTWHRPATPETMGITPVAEIGDDKNAHIEPAQNSDSETSTTGQTLISRNSSGGGTETTSAGENSVGIIIVETSGTGAGTETESETSTGPTDSTEKPSTPNLSELQTLRKQAEKESSKNPKREDVSSSTTTTSRYKRSSAVREYALVRADGKCEVCDKDAPFIKESGDPYLEVHHVNELSDGGADDPSIVGAVCPSCHKEIHYGKDGDELNEKLRERLQDGLGNVGVVDK
jgi:5-methylcytosine-specific restriction endonuclease McrA